ncbi:MAG: hypothetical protein ACYDAR_13590 [Thermomicrobiales bacterium]
MPHQQTRQMALTMVTASIAIALLATSALAMLGQPPASPVPSQFVPAPAAIQDIGPEAFGVLPSIRPQDGNGLDFSGPGISPNPFNPIVDFSGRHEQARYVIDATPILPESAPVIRPNAPLPTEQAVRDFAARIGMAGPFDIRHQGGTWDYTLGALDSITGAQATLGSRGTFGYSAPDPGARCGEATATPFRYPPPVLLTPPSGVGWTPAPGILPTVTPGTSPPLAPTYPPTPTTTPFGVGSDLCASRSPALDDATAAAVAQDFLSRAGFLPDASYTMQVLPLDARMPTLRAVRWTTTAPNGGRFIGRDASRDIGVQVGPDKKVTNAGGALPLSGASSSYRLRSATDLAAALQAGEAYVTLTLPLAEGGYPAFRFAGNEPLGVHVTGAELGYFLAYTFDAQPYLLPVVIYTGAANTAESLAIGKEIGFTAYVDAVAHPTPQAVPVTPTVPLPVTPDLAALASFTITGPSFTRADFDALASALGFDNSAATVTSRPVGNGEGFLAKYPDGSTLGANYQGGEWQYDNGGPYENTPTAPALSPDAALALVQQFITAHHVDLSNLGTPTSGELPGGAIMTVCYPLLINNAPLANGRCGLRAFIESGGRRFTLTADPLLVALQRKGAAALQPTLLAGSAAVSAQDALNMLATAPKPIPADADLSQTQWQLARLLIEDDPEQAVHHREGNTLYATRGQAAPNQFTADRVTLAYYLTTAYGSVTHQTTYQLLPVWLISGQIDIGNRHRVAPFTYLYPALR